MARPGRSKITKVVKSKSSSGTAESHQFCDRIGILLPRGEKKDFMPGRVTKDVIDVGAAVNFEEAGTPHVWTANQASTEKQA